MRNFGHDGPEKFQGLGINGKNSEFHAAMGICNFPHVPNLISARKKIVEIYDSKFIKSAPLAIFRPKVLEGTESNYAYYPIYFQSESVLLNVLKELNEVDIFPRRYFYPSLNALNYLPFDEMPVSESISRRVLCLPLFHDLDAEKAVYVADVVLAAIENIR